MAEELLGTEIGLAFIIIGILLFLVEATMPGFLVAVPGTVLIALGILTVSYTHLTLPTKA